MSNLVSSFVTPVLRSAELKNFNFNETKKSSPLTVV